jgi:hypothetical protein
MIHALRYAYEGRAYDVALSSKIGDICLAGFICIGAYIIKQPQFDPPTWMEGLWFQFGMALFSILCGILCLILIKPEYEGDMYHAIWVIPFFIYFLCITSPVLYLYGNMWQKVLGISFVFVWLLLVIYDIQTGRMEQRKYIARHQYEWQFEK